MIQLDDLKSLDVLCRLSNLKGNKSFTFNKKKSLHIDLSMAWVDSQNHRVCSKKR